MGTVYGPSRRQRPRRDRWPLLRAARQNALDEVAYKFGDEMLTLRLAQGQSYLRGATAHKKGSPK